MQKHLLSLSFWFDSEFLVVVAKFVVEEAHIVAGDHFLDGEIALAVDDVVTWGAPGL